MELKSKIDERDVFGKTPLAYALENLNFEIVKILLKNGSNPLKIRNFRTIEKKEKKPSRRCERCFKMPRFCKKSKKI